MATEETSAERSVFRAARQARVRSEDSGADPPRTTETQLEDATPAIERGGLKKLVIQIPCYNEAESLPVTLGELPRSIPGVAAIEWLVIDDGSVDGTAEVARRLGVDHVVRLPRHQGLARAFIIGLEASVQTGADIIVNTDADNQYEAADIPRLVEPIIAGRADIVIGARPIGQMPEFSFPKRWLQRLGSSVVRRLSKTDIPDAPSGFRAFGREAARRMNVFSEYTYTLETIIQAGQKGMAITSVPVRVNPKLRDSRLVQNLPRYIRRQALTMVRIFMTYRPFQFFAAPGAIIFMAGFLVGVRFLYYYFSGAGSGHVQSLILGALLMGTGFFLIITGFVADLMAVNRKLLEDLSYRVGAIEDVSRATAEPPGEKPRA